MTEDQRSIASFVIRFTQHMWQDPQGEPQIQWRGNIRHVQGDEEASFIKLSDALSFIQKHLTQLTQDATVGKTQLEQEKALSESYKLWEQLTASYSEWAVDAMKNTFEQSEVLTEHIEAAVSKALQAWHVTKPIKDKDVSEAIENINQQVYSVIEKINLLEKLLNSS